MKNLLFLFIFTFGFFGYSQDNASLEKQIGFEANLFSPGIGISYELPVLKNTLIDFTGGFSMPILKGWGAIGLDDSRFKPHTRIEAKYYYNRAKRLRKGKEINNNRGNFFGIQNKTMYGDITEDSTRLLNEIHWGVQTEIAQNLLLTFHIGFAHYYTKEKWNGYSPILEFKFKYVF